MSAPLRLLTPPQMPTTTDEQPPKPGRREIARMAVTSTYCHPADVACYLRMLDMARRLRDLTGEPFPFEAACVSYMLDADKGRLRSQYDYASLWGWTRWEVRSRWEEIAVRVADWRTAYGRLENSEISRPRTAQPPPKPRPVIGDSVEDSQCDRPAAAQAPPGGRPHTNQLSTLNSQENTSSSQAFASDGDVPTESGSDDEPQECPATAPEAQGVPMDGRAPENPATATDGASIGQPTAAGEPPPPARAKRGPAVKRAGAEDHRLAGLLWELMLRNDPERAGHKVQPNLADWAEHVEKLYRLDEQPYATIEAVIRWSQADRFWSENILSGKTLREKFHRLRLKMNRGQQTPSSHAAHQHAPIQPRTDQELAERLVERMRQRAKYERTHGPIGGIRPS